ncbi:MAG: hypothetical protein HY580_02540, partial [Nitrospinae bacterium]|nr:hypothetical protein [Nitrospinota bacterium]
MLKQKLASLTTLTAVGLLAFALSGPAMAGNLRVAEAPKAEGSGSKADPYTGMGMGMGMEHGKSQTPPGHGAASPHGSAAGKAEGSASKEYTHPGAGKSYGHGAGYGDGRGSFAHHGVHSDPFAHVLRFKTPLGLTPDQTAEIEKLWFEYKKQRIQSEADHEIAHLEMDRLAHSATVDEAAMH